MHWATNYIGKPWGSGAEGPDMFNCLGLVRFVLFRMAGIELPVVNVDDHSLRHIVNGFRRGEFYTGWEQVDKPQELDGVIMSHKNHPHHVGLWVDVDGGKVLHCVTGAGVVAMDRLHLRLAGWHIISFWRHERCRPR